MKRRYALFPALASLSAIIAFLSGCATYEPLALSSTAPLAPNVASLARTEFSLGHPLSVTEIGILAVENNPDLVAVRAQRRVAQAQLLQAGLLPNPQVSAAILPLVAGIGTTNAWTAALSQDIRSLITLSSTRSAAQASADQVDAQVLWQEWQIVGQARLLAIDIIQNERLMTILRENHDLLASRYEKSRIAVLAGNQTLTSSAPDLTAMQSVASQLRDLERQQLTRRHQLAALLGLAPDAHLMLAAKVDLPRWDSDAVYEGLATLAQRRPDLVALQFGFRAQDAKVRAAILSQFPNLSIGVTGGSDNSNVRNVGPQITLELPIFNQNQGNIAIETATRQQLHDEYTARLTTATGQVRAMAAEIKLISRQLSGVRKEMTATRQIAAKAESAFKEGNIDERSYVDFVVTRINKEQEIVTMEQALLDQQIAIATLIGAGMPQIVLPSGEEL